MREENEPYKQDDLGNVQRELDPVRASVGSSDSGTTPSGFVTGTTDTYNELLELPEDSREFYLEQIAVGNTTASAVTVVIHEADRDGSGGYENMSQRSVTYQVPADSTETVDYQGEAFTSDLVLVATADTVEVSAGGYLNTPEEYEPNSEEVEIGSQ